jgi:hypothetical protein
MQEMFQFMIDRRFYHFSFYFSLSPVSNWWWQFYRFARRAFRGLCSFPKRLGWKCGDSHWRQFWTSFGTPSARPWCSATQQQHPAGAKITLHGSPWNSRHLLGQLSWKQ